MATPIQGSKPVREWLSLLRDSSSPVSKRLYDIAGGDPAMVKETLDLCLKTMEAFGEAYGSDMDVILVRSTGRANLVGMHVDHRGGSVNTVAIKNTILVASPRDDDRVILRDVRANWFSTEEFSIHECLPNTKITDWETWCYDEFEKHRGEPGITWSNYVRAAVLHLQHLHTRDDGSFAPALHGMNVMVCGSVQRAAGLSTSSSLVVAAAEACVRMNDLRLDTTDFIEACGYGEWYVGTRGGAGDHAAIKSGQAKGLVHITSFPFTREVVPFPEQYRIVLANSLIEAKKQAGARDKFNRRIAAYNFGFMILQSRFPEHGERLEHLRDLNPETLGVPEAEIYRMIGVLPEFASRQDVLDALPNQHDDIRLIFRSHTEPEGGYKLRQVCMFGVSECRRANMVTDLLKAGDMETFNRLLRHNVRKLEAEDTDYIITACATCTATIKEIWPIMVDHNTEDIKATVDALASKTLDINQFLVAKAGLKVVDNDVNIEKVKVTYHDPCHLKKGLGVSSEPRAVIEAAGKYELVEMKEADACCGMGGSFNLQYYDISSRIGNLKRNNIHATGCSILATGCPACMMQISDAMSKAGDRIAVKHPIEIYAKMIKKR